MATSWTQADIDAVEAAIVTLATQRTAEVHFSDRSVRNFGPADIPYLLKLLDQMKPAVAQSVNGPQTRVTYGQFSKG